MAPLTTSPTLKLSRLRDIGWSLWDPIGLLTAGDRWDEGENLAFADEYDAYWIEAAGLLRRGAPDNEVVDFLVGIETDHMGLSLQHDTHERAISTVAAIRADLKV